MFSINRWFVILQGKKSDITKTTHTTEIFYSCHKKNFDFLYIFVQNLDCKYMLELPPKANLTRTRNLCFGSKNKENRHILDSLYNPVLLYKRGYTCFPNGKPLRSHFPRGSETIKSVF